MNRIYLSFEYNNLKVTTGKDLDLHCLDLEAKLAYSSQCDLCHWVQCYVSTLNFFHFYQLSMVWFSQFYLLVNVLLVVSYDICFSLVFLISFLFLPSWIDIGGEKYVIPLEVFKYDSLRLLERDGFGSLGCILVVKVGANVLYFFPFVFYFRGFCSLDSLVGLYSCFILWNFFFFFFS